MKAALSLKEEVDLLVQNRFHKYSDKLNTRFEKTNELRFNELKNILTRFNEDYFVKNYLPNQSDQ